MGKLDYVRKIIQFRNFRMAPQISAKLAKKNNRQKSEFFSNFPDRKTIINRQNLLENFK